MQSNNSNIDELIKCIKILSVGLCNYNPYCILFCRTNEKFFVVRGVVYILLGQQQRSLYQTCDSGCFWP